MLTPSGVTRLLDGLERDGWVTKGACETDARVTYAVLTEEGRERLESAGPDARRPGPRDFEERFSPEELETLVELLGRLPGGAAGRGEACSPCGYGGLRRARTSASIASRSPSTGRSTASAFSISQAVERRGNLLRREQDARVLRAARAVLEVVAVVADDEQRPAAARPPRRPGASTAASSSAGSWR